MKISEIIEKLCAHEITKAQAISQLTEITDGLRTKAAYQFRVEEVATRGNEAVLKIHLQTAYPENITSKVDKYDKIDVIFLP